MNRTPLSAQNLRLFVPLDNLLIDHSGMYLVINKPCYVPGIQLSELVVLVYSIIWRAGLFIVFCLSKVCTNLYGVEELVILCPTNGNCRKSADKIRFSCLQMSHSIFSLTGF